MVKQRTIEEKFCCGTKTFPILYKDDRLMVYKNPLNEIFVVDIQSGVEMRISSCDSPGGGIEFYAAGILETFPRMENGRGWRIRSDGR